MKPTLIVFTGLPGTGKTTLSQQVAERLRIPRVGKDDIKEIMYDKIGWSDKAFSAKLAQATFGIMEYLTEQHLKNNMPIILESNYSPRLANEQFQKWQETYGCTIIQIVCQTDLAVLVSRFYERQNTDRHPGHNDTDPPHELMVGFKQRLENGEDQPLAVDGPVRIINTTDFATVDLAAITSWIQTSEATIGA